LQVPEAVQVNVSIGQADGRRRQTAADRRGPLPNNFASVHTLSQDSPDKNKHCHRGIMPNSWVGQSCWC